MNHKMYKDYSLVINVKKECNAVTSIEKVWNHSFESMILIDYEGNILNMNRPAMRLFSLYPTTFKQVSIFEIIPKEELEKYLFSKKEITGIQISFGTEELLMNLVPIESKVLLIIKNMTPLYQLKQKLKTLNETKVIFDKILDKLEEGICGINSEGKIIFYNKKMGEIDVCEPETVKGKHLFEAFPYLHEDTSTLIKSIKIQKKLHHRETHFTNKGKPITTLARTFPLIIGERILGSVEIVKDITEQKNLSQTINQLQQKKMFKKNKLDHNNTRFEFKHIIYQSREMRQTVEQARRSARTSSNILLIGETGTGKELFAQSIHNESPRNNHPFIAQNCAALPESLLEGLLFGTTIGSFTGAVEREGLLEQAHRGTLLLDEINSMGTNLQAKLLRFLQEKKVQRLGSKKVIDVDVRIIATMNEDPFDAIEKGHLREDLFYRLSVVNLIIQPLRMRKDDIPLLVNHFIQKHAKSLNMQVEGIEEDVMEMFLQYSWPGNVRELEHVIEGCLNFMYDEKKISFHHLSPAFQEKILKQNNDQKPMIENLPTSTFSSSLDEQKVQLEQTLIKKALKETKGNITKAGELLGISRQNLNYKLKKYNIKPRW